MFRQLVDGFAVPFFGEHVGGGYPAYSEYDEEKVAGAGKEVGGCEEDTHLDEHRGCHNLDFNSLINMGLSVSIQGQSQSWRSEACSQASFRRLSCRAMICFATSNSETVL